MRDIKELTEEYSKKTDDELKEIIIKNDKAKKRENTLTAIIMGVSLSFFATFGVYYYLNGIDKEEAKKNEWVATAIGGAGITSVIGYFAYCRKGKKGEEYKKYKAAERILEDRTKEDSK